nr:immunoglobulin heavy chain junction region [Mus musculus]
CARGYHYYAMDYW